ncbi:unnamed protein product [Somion occarium]|uniref:Uncharacterized protein n=1 Tax=Somion occarium TaxID=3059160 RepID=A0ABP1CSX0_9APHY
MPVAVSHSELLKDFLVGPHCLFTPRSFFPDRILPNPIYLRHDDIPSLKVYDRCQFRTMSHKQKRWGAWKSGILLGTDHVTLPSGHQLRRYLVGQRIDGRYLEDGRFLPPSTERSWVLPALGQLYPEGGPKPMLRFDEALQLLNSWRLVPVWYRGEADVLSILHRDYDSTEADCSNNFPGYAVRLIEGPFLDNTVDTYRALPATDASTQLLAQMGQISYQALIDSGIVKDPKATPGMLELGKYLSSQSLKSKSSIKRASSTRLRHRSPPVYCSAELTILPIHARSSLEGGLLDHSLLSSEHVPSQAV